MNNAKQRKRGPHITRVITSEDQVPAGYVQLRTYRSDDHNLAQALSLAQIDGLVPAVKMMRTPIDKTGPVYIDKVAADAFAKAWMEKVERQVAAKAQAIQDTAAQAGLRGQQELLPVVSATPNHMDVICERLERIAVAMHTITEQNERMINLMKHLDAAWNYQESGTAPRA